MLELSHHFEFYILTSDKKGSYPMHSEASDVKSSMFYVAENTIKNLVKQNVGKLF